MRNLLNRFAVWLTNKTTGTCEFDPAAPVQFHRGRYILTDETNDLSRTYIVQFEEDVPVRCVLENLRADAVDAVHCLPGMRLKAFPDQLYWEEK